MQLNPHQEEVAGHVHGRILTLAGPGSGKTRTLTERTGRLIARGIGAANILCLTFTNKARDEMRERIAAVHGQAAKKVFISNFHGLCGIVLRRMGSPLGYTDRLTVADADDQVDLLMQIARKKGMEPTKPQARMLASVANDWRENLGSEADWDDYSARVDDAELSVIRQYFKVLRSRNQCDFSGLLSETVRLLRESPDARDRLQKRFRFIQVDEYQDTNRAQNEIVELLAGAEDNVLAVGDADQSIYAWRGASPDAIPRFIRNGQAKTGTCRVVKLGVNYRSTPEIIAVADKLIKHSADRIAVEFTATNKPGDPVKCVSLPAPEDEAEVVAMNIQTLMRTGTPAREMAVFYRTNDMSRLVEQALSKRQIPYQVIGGGSYYDRMEVKDVLSMLRFLCNPRDGISFARIANKPARGMGDALVGKLEAYAERHDTDVLSAMRAAVRAAESAADRVPEDSMFHPGPHPRGNGETAAPQAADGFALNDAAVRACRDALHVFGFDLSGKTVAEVVNDVLDRTKYDQWLKERYEEKNEYESRSRNVNELTNAIADFCRKEPEATVGDYLQSIALYTGGDHHKDDNAVRLMSLHASKGLEFDVVYLIGVEHGILPHEKAVKDRGPDGLEEERRLCYVGFTRARKLLRVTWCQKRQDVFSRSRTAQYVATRPSRFLVEAGLMTADEYQAVVKPTGPGALRKPPRRGAGRGKK